MMDEPGRRLELPVKDQRIEVRAVGSDDGTQLLVDVYLDDEARIGQRLEYRAVECSGGVDIA